MRAINAPDARRKCKEFRHTYSRKSARARDHQPILINLVTSESAGDAHALVEVKVGAFDLRDRRAGQDGRGEAGQHGAAGRLGLGSSVGWKARGRKDLLF